jgi:hypothetical protein
MQSRLDITGVLSDTVTIIQNRGAALVRSAMLPAMLLVTANQLSIHLNLSPLIDAALVFSMPVWFTLYMVPVMRGVLINEEGIGRKWGLHWGWDETRFLLRYLIIAAVPLVTFLVLLAFALWLIPPDMRESATEHWGMRVLGVLNMTFIFYVAVRLSMMLPAAAIGDQANPSQSWRLTRHNGWRLMGLYVLIMLVFAVLTLLLSLVLLPLLEHPPVRWIIGVINAIIGVVGVAAIATVYRKLSINEPAKE